MSQKLILKKTTSKTLSKRKNSKKDISMNHSLQKIFDLDEKIETINTDIENLYRRYSQVKKERLMKEHTQHILVNRIKYLNGERGTSRHKSLSKNKIHVRVNSKLSKNNNNYNNYYSINNDNNSIKSNKSSINIINHKNKNHYKSKSNLICRSCKDIKIENMSKYNIIKGSNINNDNNNIYIIINNPNNINQITSERKNIPNRILENNNINRNDNPINQNNITDINEKENIFLLNVNGNNIHEIISTIKKVTPCNNSKCLNEKNNSENKNIDKNIEFQENKKNRPNFLDLYNNSNLEEGSSTKRTYRRNILKDFSNSKKKESPKNTNFDKKIDIQKLFIPNSISLNNNSKSYKKLINKKIVNNNSNVMDLSSNNSEYSLIQKNKSKKKLNGNVNKIISNYYPQKYINNYFEYLHPNSKYNTLHNNRSIFTPTPQRFPKRNIINSSNAKNNSLISLGINNLSNVSYTNTISNNINLNINYNSLYNTQNKFILNNHLKKETYCSSIEKKRKALGLEKSALLQNYQSLRESNIVINELSKIDINNNNITNAIKNEENEKLIKVRKRKMDEDIKNKTQPILYKKVAQTNYNNLFKKIKTTSNFYNYRNNVDRNEEENNIKNASTVVPTKSKKSYIKIKKDLINKINIS